MYDLHLHTTLSDGDLSPEQLVAEAQRRGVQGLSITDHNGLWAHATTQALAREQGLAYVPGIEISSCISGVDVHVLGYSQAFIPEVLEQGLATTRAGYAARIAEMVQLCQQQGFSKISFDAIAQRRRAQTNPSYISYDVALELTHHEGLSMAEARQHTVHGGSCYVPYGDWALAPAAVITLLHDANALAIIAHPGIIAQEHGPAIMWRILNEAVAAHVDGIEIYHPFHPAALNEELLTFSAKNNLLVTGGSDWHGAGRYHDADFGKIGVTAEQFTAIQQALN